MKQPFTAAAIDTKIPLLVFLPVVLILVVWLLPDGDLKHQAVVSGDSELPENVRTVAIKTHVGHVDVIIGDSGKVRWEGQSMHVVRIRDGERAKAVLASVKDQPLRLTSSIEGDELVLTSTALADGVTEKEILRQMNLVVRVPANLNVRIDCFRANIGIEKRHGSIDIRSGGGTMMLRANSGDVRIVMVEAPPAKEGEEKSMPRADDIVVDEHRGKIDVTNTGGGKVIVSTVDVVGNVRLNTKDGALTCRVPKTANFEMDLLSRGTKGSSKVVNGFGFKSVENKDGSKQVVGKIGEGGPMIRLRSDSGTIALLPIE